ncbi:MAG: HD-GYP domain-containing protein [Pseudomonadota bacterium]
MDDIRIGMYVAELDRPWVETPFLFQGFVIEDESVIDELRQHCRYVFVDAEREDGTITVQTPMVAANQASVDRDSGSYPVDSTAALRTELTIARDVHSEAQQTVGTLFARVAKNEPLDLSAIENTIDPMIDSIIRNEDAMSWLVRMRKKDDYIHSHSLSCSVWALVFGKHLNLEKRDLQTLATGAMFLDVGKTQLPGELLSRPGKLVDNELKLMRQHVAAGTKIVRRIRGLDSRVIEMVAHHHERHNGTGYPRGLRGNDIPVFARIAGIVDSYDAMTSARPYAKAISTFDAVRKLNKIAGVEFSEEMVEQFVQSIGIFPVGSLVELNTGEVGIVVAQNRIRRLRPKIMLILDRNKQRLETHDMLDLRQQLTIGNASTSLWIERGLTAGEYGIDPADYYL